jgi:hypothetical protein
MNVNEGAQVGPGAEFRTEIECRAFKRFAKNTLIGFVTLKITPPGLSQRYLPTHKERPTLVELPCETLSKRGRDPAVVPNR